ncbi:uncharacterized protein LOC131215356 [Anopheles bellator]|uniref:uncharacterized protein LOC131215356 n=1 Tax=Anopheles bellator TaxID=139047 RepID=UPI0026477742|nr:uncharacterized protein LOC131215356 [Anopheles bellator]
MNVAKSRKLKNQCIVELECTEDSEPFQKRVVSFYTGTEALVSRLDRKPPINKDKTLYFSNRVVSRKHAALFYLEGKFYLKDLGSRNGSYLNGELIGCAESEVQPTEAREIKSGDVVRFGIPRTTVTSGELYKPIEGRLTLTAPNDLRERKSAGPMKCFTPFEGHLEHAELPNVSNEAPVTTEEEPKIVNSPKNAPKSLTHQGTETETVKSSDSETQTTDDNDANNLKSHQKLLAQRCSFLQTIILCMLIIVAYQFHLLFFSID